MREILFRGKTYLKQNNQSFNNVWVEGDLIVSKNKFYIHPHANVFKVENELAKLMVCHEVIPETIGQYTGLTDKNGNKIFEGDIVKDTFGRIMEVVFRGKFVKFAFRLIKATGKKWTNNFCFSDMKEWFLCGIPEVEVIGNIHDNPELLKE